jgi:hypothetical protein
MPILPSDLVDLINVPSPDQRAKVETFARHVCVHDKIKAVLSQSVHEGLCAPEGRIISIVGPTGVGKSTASLLAHRCINEYYRSQMEKDPGFIPVITTALFHAEDPRSAYRSMYMGIIEEVEPVRAAKQANTNASAFIQQSQRHTALALRKAAQSIVKNRNLKLLQIDEGHALVAAACGRDGEYQCSVLKSFLNTTKIPCLIYAPYAFYQAVQEDTQIARRTTFIHLRPYGTSEDETLAFLQIAQEFLDELPLPVAPDFLDEHTQFILDKSLRCVGLLKGLLQSGLIHAYQAHARQLRIEHLEKGAMLEGVLEAMRFDILSGGILFGEQAAPKDDGQAVASPPKYSRRKVGRRHPTRDRLKNPQRGLI